MKNLIVVLDLLKGFVKFGSMADKGTAKIIPQVKKILEETQNNENNEWLEIFDCHKLTDEEFLLYAVHCLEGSEECELVEELDEFKDCFDYYVPKNTTNGFNTEAFQKILAQNKFGKIFVCGLLTDICIYQFVESLLNYIKENKLPITVVISPDTCYTFEAPNHEAEAVHKQYVEKMKKLGAKVCKNAEEVVLELNGEKDYEKNC